MAASPIGWPSLDGLMNGSSTHHPSDIGSTIYSPLICSKARFPNGSWSTQIHFDASMRGFGKFHVPREIRMIQLKGYIPKSWFPLYILVHQISAKTINERLFQAETVHGWHLASDIDQQSWIVQWKLQWLMALSCDCWRSKEGGYTMDFTLW